MFGQNQRSAQLFGQLQVYMKCVMWSAQVNVGHSCEREMAYLLRVVFFMTVRAQPGARRHLLSDSLQLQPIPH